MKLPGAIKTVRVLRSQSRSTRRCCKRCSRRGAKPRWPRCAACRRASKRHSRRYTCPCTNGSRPMRRRPPRSSAACSPTGPRRAMSSSHRCCTPPYLLTSRRFSACRPVLPKSSTGWLREFCAITRNACGRSGPRRRLRASPPRARSQLGPSPLGRSGRLLGISTTLTPPARAARRQVPWARALRVARTRPGASRRAKASRTLRSSPRSFAPVQQRAVALVRVIGGRLTVSSKR